MKVNYGAFSGGLLSGRYMIHLDLKKIKNLDKAILKIFNYNFKYKAVFMQEPFLDNERMLMLTLAANKAGYATIIKTNGKEFYQWIPTSNPHVIVETSDKNVVLKYGNELWYNIEKDNQKEPLITSNIPIYVGGASLTVCHNFIKRSKNNWGLLLKPKTILEVVNV